MTSLNTIARQFRAELGNMTAFGANFFNDWGEKVSSLLTPVYEYFSGGRIALQKRELDAIDNRIINKLALLKSQGVPIHVPCLMNGTKHTLVLEETNAGYKISDDGKSVILPNIKSHDQLHELLMRERDEINDTMDIERMLGARYQCSIITCYGSEQDTFSPPSTRRRHESVAVSSTRQPNWRDSSIKLPQAG